MNIIVTDYLFSKSYPDDVSDSNNKTVSSGSAMNDEDLEQAIALSLVTQAEDQVKIISQIESSKVTKDSLSQFQSSTSVKVTNSEKNIFGFNKRDVRI